MWSVDDVLKEDIYTEWYFSCLGYLKMYLQNKQKKRMGGFFFNLKVYKAHSFETFFLFISETEIKKTTSATLNTN